MECFTQKPIIMPFFSKEEHMEKMRKTMVDMHISLSFQH